jgi:catechol 2,3-dioxygenase-like lactoylglutathione lyase family enzyme
MSASITESKTAITFIRTVPILRIFSVEKAKEFYCGFLGFTVNWEHTFEPGMPGVDEFHREITAKDYRYLRPSVQDEFYGARAVHVIDPFGNRISFNEFKEPRESA